MLITGAAGLLGNEIVARFGRLFDVRAIDVRECDVTDLSACRRAILAFRPEVVVHCAAYTAVDRAESEEERAMAVNEGGTRHVASVCREAGALLVTFGSDYVFDGTSSLPYREEDPARPLSAYGRSKWAAEIALREEAPDHLLVRTQWLFGFHGRHFLSAVIEKARRGEPLRVVSDQVGSPTFARDLAEAVERLLAAGARGTVHFSNEGETSWHGLASYALARALPGFPPPAAARTAELGYPAPRPAYSVLSKKKYRRITGTVPRTWEEAVLDYIGGTGPRP